jgi:hypothetical protein
MLRLFALLRVYNIIHPEYQPHFQFLDSTVQLSLTKLLLDLGSIRIAFEFASPRSCHSRYATAALPNLPPFCPRYVPRWPVLRDALYAGRPLGSSA